MNSSNNAYKVIKDVILANTMDRLNYPRQVLTDIVERIGFTEEMESFIQIAICQRAIKCEGTSHIHFNNWARQIGSEIADTISEKEFITG